MDTLDTVIQFADELRAAFTDADLDREDTTTILRTQCPTYYAAFVASSYAAVFSAERYNLSAELKDYFLNLNVMRGNDDYVERLINALINHLRPTAAVLEEQADTFNAYELSDDQDDERNDIDDAEPVVSSQRAAWEEDQEVVPFGSGTMQADGPNDENQTDIDELANRVNGWITQIENALESFSHRHYEQYRRYIDQANVSLVPTDAGRLMLSEESLAAETKASDKKDGLTAFQKFILIRLLQEAGLFPGRPTNADESNELRFIALLTGLSYENDIKGGAGAKAKAYKLFSDKDRRSMSFAQAKNKLADLDVVAEVASLLNLDKVLERIDELRSDLKQIIDK